MTQSSAGGKKQTKCCLIFDFWKNGIKFLGFNDTGNQTSKNVMLNGEMS